MREKQPAVLLTHGWTGGQYSVVRALLGAWIAVDFANRISSEHERVVVLLLVVGVAAGLLLIVGYLDRLAAVGAACGLASLIGRNPLIANSALPYIGWLLLMHALVPPAPYGSLAARGRIDPGGGWELPRGLFTATWIVMAAGYGYGGITKLAGPLPLTALATWIGTAELLFLPLALFARARRWIWLALVGMQLGQLLLLDSAELRLRMLLLHAFTFDPAWLRGSGAGRDTAFYDGDCGLCHRTVRFLLAEDPAGERFTFAPLAGPTFAARVAESERRDLPDSIIVQTAEGRLLVRTSAILHLLKRLGGLWRAAAAVVGILPGSWTDRAYDAVARVRRRLFARPADACPIVPEELRKRFLP